MKNQIVAILAIVAVITALITVSAFSNEEGYNVTPCDAIDISLENTTVTDFLNATNMTTVQVYNFKGYKGENTWMVQWFSSNRLLDVYVNVATGAIVGIEEKTGLSPTPTPTPTPTLTPTPTPETKTWHSVATFRDRSDKETPTFSIKGDIWCMVWQTVGCGDGSSILVTVYKDLGFMTFVDGFSGNGADTYCVYKGPGSYYLDIDTTSLEYWEIKVEDYY